MPQRHHILPDAGTLLVSTDVHGMAEDFARMRTIFEGESEDTHWVILGDLVHAPSDEARGRRPDLYDYDDGSAEIVASVCDLVSTHPERVHFVLGNHDWAHIGGPPTRKFHKDEAAHLESSMDADAVAALRELFYDALFCMAAPCGVFLSHGSPGALLELGELGEIDLRGELSAREQALVKELNTFYGQRRAVSSSFLDHMSRETGLKLTIVVHGHDRDEEGWFAHEDTQICPVIFGAPRDQRRYLRFDLAARYDSVNSLREGVEIRRLWDEQ